MIPNHSDAAPAEGDNDIPRRAYITTTVRQRLHQRGFRERVRHAYREQCALCRLRHTVLLDAAHIIPDSEEAGTPHVSNGLSLCQLHHAAFDRFLLGITPDYTVELRADILDEKDGPILRHDLQGLHKTQIVLPRRQVEQPSQELLAEQYERFRKTG